MRNRVKTKINKKSAIVISQGVSLILLLYLVSSLFYFSKPILPKPLFLPKKLENLFLMLVLSFFLCCLSLSPFLPLSSPAQFSLLSKPTFFFFFFSTFLSGFFHLPFLSLFPKIRTSQPFLKNSPRSPSSFFCFSHSLILESFFLRITTPFVFFFF